ncbi:MAG: hypothetical protein BWY76_01342 [bacterium ADurb.Bin429]|nr:MAG: hypothetical protein BWY76_01342 [bacterium ADurb.Bin429]
MTASTCERRGHQECEICDNGLLRLRITRETGAQTLMLDAMDAHGHWIPLLASAPAVDLLLRDNDGAEQGAAIYAFAPVLEDGVTRGVTLQGRLGQAELEMTLLLDIEHAWCRQWIELAGPIPPGATLAQRWFFTGGLAEAALRWPAEPVTGAVLATSPAAFAQDTHCFAALLPDPDTYAGGQLRHLADDGGGLEYALTLTPDASARCFSSLLVLDARALAGRGFQQLARLLARAEAPPMPDAFHPAAGNLTSLPEIGQAGGWQPFLREGAPAEMAASVLRGLSQAADGDWAVLDEALVWLDRMCLHQCLRPVPGGPPVGTVGEGPAWVAVAPWMPILLLEAFRLSGITEYANRGRAALGALPTDQASRVYAYLYPRFGDLCVLPDYEEVLALTDLGLVLPTFGDRRIDLRLPEPRTRPLRLVVDGRASRYGLSINERSYGDVATDVLRLGIEVPA